MDVLEAWQQLHLNMTLGKHLATFDQRLLRFKLPCNCVRVD